MPLDRSSVLREDPAWIRRQLDSDKARLLPLWRNRNLFVQSGERNEPVACFIERQYVEVVVRDSTELIYLGHDRNSPVFAADITHLEEHHANQLISTAGAEAEFIDLRIVGPTLPSEEASIMAYARGLIYWHRQNQFCGRCGNSTRSHRGGHMRRCIDDSCGRELFPRIDPAVIMLVEQLEPEDGIAKCLMGRHQGLPTRVYSTLAGYVDPGESLEQAVAREIMEEAGITVCQTTYLASQPWPFPGAMMVGFHARTRDRKIIVAKDELEDARWFTAAEIREFGEYNDSGTGLALPRRDSIARTLIETWLGAN
jgi:NAD+ diphosphatase